MHQLLVSFDGFVPVVALFPVAVVVAAVSVLLRSRLLRTVSSFYDPLVDALLVYSVLSIAYLVLSPQPAIPEQVRLPLGDDFSMALRARPGDSLPWVQLAGNLVLLLPLGSLVPLRVPRFDNVGRIAIGGLAVSTMIELVQFLAVSGRVASTDDIVLNTLGAAIGGLLVRPPWRRVVVEGAERVEAAGPQHSISAQDGPTVWLLIEKIEREHHLSRAQNTQRHHAVQPARRS